MGITKERGGVGHTFSCVGLRRTVVSPRQTGVVSELALTVFADSQAFGSVQPGENASDVDGNRP